MFKYIVLLFIICVRVSSELLYKYEGAPCVWGKLNGKCAHIFQCSSSMEDLKQKNFPPICAFKGKEPIVCCTDCNLEKDVRKLLYIPNVGELINTGSKSEEHCYNYLKALDYPCKRSQKTARQTTVDEIRNCNNHSIRVTEVNDTLVEKFKNHFPHIAYLGYGENLDKTDWLCTGSVISERFILTSADCVRPDNSVGNVRFVALGIHKRWVSPAKWERYNVKRTIIHPQYKPPSKYHDIALLETEKIQFGPNVLPACLDLGLSDDATSFVIWGKGENGTLESVPLAHFDELQCSFFYPPQKTLKDGYNHSTQVCFGDRIKPKDSCESELGSPLQYTLKSCAYVIRGVASVKRVCGHSGGSGLFTRVAHYLPWIETIVWI